MPSSNANSAVAKSNAAIQKLHKSEKLLNIVSIITLILAGLFFLYEGSVLVNSHRENPQKVSSKLAVAGTLTIVLGIASLVLAALHLFIFPPKA